MPLFAAPFAPDEPGFTAAGLPGSVAEPGAAAVEPWAGDELTPAEGALCAVIAPVNIVPAASVTSRSAFIDLLVIRLPHRGNVFPPYCDGVISQLVSPHSKHLCSEIKSKRILIKYK
jgi:hypothetical protein